jgi:hypothetical protein
VQPSLPDRCLPVGEHPIYPPSRRNYIRAVTVKRHERWAQRYRTICLAVVAALVILALPAGAAADIYWSNGSGNTHSVARANLDGTGVDLTFIPDVHADGVAVDAGHVYWSTFVDGTIGRADLDGSALDQSFITGPAVGEVPGAMAVDSQHIYWVSEVSNNSYIFRANLDGSGAIGLLPATGSEGVAVDAGQVYWTNTEADTIGRADLDGGDVDQSFISGLTAPWGIAVDGQHIYWANRISESISRANLDGTEVDQTFITGIPDPTEVAVDAQHLYWTDNSADEIGRADLDGSGVEKGFITGLNHPGGLALDPPPGSGSGPSPLPSPAPVVGPPAPGAPPPPPPDPVKPTNAFKLGGTKLNRGQGSAILTVAVPGPGRLTLSGKGLMRVTRNVTKAGAAKLAVRPTTVTKAKLASSGRAKVMATITFTPTGGDPHSESKTLSLKLP